MKAVLYDRPESFSVTELKMPKVGKKQVLIKVALCGVCGTDVHIHKGEFISQFPLTPGHEFVGEVIEVGEEVTGIEVGSRVAVDNTILCGHCYYCKRNQPLYCENFYSLGCTGPGGFAEYVVAKFDKVFPIDGLTYEQAVMVEPISCAVHGLDKIDVQPGDSALLFGAGPTGIVLAQLLKHSGVSNLVVAAPAGPKLELVKKILDVEVVELSRTDHQKHVVEVQQRYPRGFDIVIDATGVPSVLQGSVQFAKFGAKIVVYGVCDESDRIELSPYAIFHKELKIIGSFAQTHCFDRAVEYLQRGIVNVDDFVTHRFSLNEFEQALNQVAHGKDHIKVVVDPTLV
ncbi:zinc-dependent alcohol dehydrogenase family protein [Alicyclobacillus dauci]|uniref:Zinc-dependent alcohol dehydrogenase family protein n=1 Tax=Alicyclobacillus dauci TaxID=1475485 RepID=A0ABY6Z5D3_9BACL|nr:zinc-dependent alcohol dehydrogenase family protein [Alicyclobacillus dauci]WAH37960.1 zinc-dependent alcohol dehydrogenase family protein [Alicyclobacillus dauci]